jgi:hypothetical protein
MTHQKTECRVLLQKKKLLHRVLRAGCLLQNVELLVNSVVPWYLAGSKFNAFLMCNHSSGVLYL